MASGWAASAAQLADLPSAAPGFPAVQATIAHVFPQKVALDALFDTFRASITLRPKKPDGGWKKFQFG
jgi:hypothetical protein